MGERTEEGEGGERGKEMCGGGLLEGRARTGTLVSECSEEPQQDRMSHVGFEQLVESCVDESFLRLLPASSAKSAQERFV